MAKKDLYLAKSFDDLAHRWKTLPDMKNKKWHVIVSSLNKMLFKAEEDYLKGDEESAYVLYMKFFTLVEMISKSSEYSDCKQKISSEVGGKSKMISTLDRMVKLKDSLINRYDQKNLHGAPQIPEPIETDQQKTPEPQVDFASLGVISCEELFVRLHKKSTLLIDVRNKEEFEASHINYLYCLNIPRDQIKNGYSAGVIQTTLDTNQRLLWSSRSVKEDVVIMGWNDADIATQTLKGIMENWDQDTTYKAPIRILKNGYEHFLMLYPAMSTDPHFKVTTAKVDDSENIDDIEYPNISDITMKEEIIPAVNRANKPNAMRIYEEKQRNLNDVMKERKILSEENFKTTQELEDTQRTMQSSHVTDEEQQRLHYKRMELESETMNQSYKIQLLENEIAELKKEQQQTKTQQLNKVEEEKPSPTEIENDKNKKPIFLVPPNPPALKDIPVPKPITLLPEIPLIDRSVKPSFNNYSDYWYQEEPQDNALTGLKNLGNTCYMNSILQCLFSDLQFRKFLTSNHYRKSLNYSSKTGGNICEETAGLFKRMDSKEYKYVECSQLKSNFGAHQKMFRGRDQQDAHEFLTIFIDCLHLELNTLDTKPLTLSSSDKFWYEFTKGKESKVLQLFYGQIKSTVKCKMCGRESATYETFSNLSLELPMQPICSLIDCLSMYFGGERIHGWICPNCKEKREAIKKLDISRLPEILVIHLKRFFVNTEYLSNVYKKKENYVEFPIDNLDVSPHLAKSEHTKATMKKYDLFAVCNHYGTMESGHYTAYCRRNSKQWYKCDDSIVTPIEQKNVLSCAAFILFYKRRGTNYVKN